MIEDIRNYTVGIDVVKVADGTVTIRPYTVVDGDKVTSDDMVLMKGDTYEVSYSKKVVFQDTIDVGNRQWSLKRELDKWRQK